MEMYPSHLLIYSLCFKLKGVSFVFQNVQWDISPKSISEHSNFVVRLALLLNLHNHNGRRRLMLHLQRAKFKYSNM